MECDPKPNTGGHRGRRFHVADAAAMPRREIYRVPVKRETQ
jgi:hypothetical protein